MPVRQKFTRAQFQTAALKIVDKEGLAALSMRSLAGALGTGPMTIYNYFEDRDELEALLVDAVMTEARMPKTGHADWRTDVRAILHGMWQAVRAHPNAIPLILTRRTSHETTLEIGEALLRALARGGYSAAGLLTAFRTLNGFVMGLAQAQLASASLDSVEKRKDPHIVRVASLPGDKFPKLHEIAYAATQIDSDQEFHAGVDVILNGLDDGPKTAKGFRRQVPKGRKAKS